LAAGAAALAALTLYAIRVICAEAAREKALRICFSIKCSYETTWLSGLSFWLVASSTYLYHLERTYAVALAVTVALAAITFGGYMATVSTRRTPKRLFGIGTSAATVVFYVALLGPTRYSVLGLPFAQFGQDALISLIAILGNAVLAIIISVLTAKDRGRGKKISH